MKNRTFAKCITILIPIGLVILYLFKDMIFAWMAFLPPCVLYTNLGLYCPACGNTRSVDALLEGDFTLAMHFNIVPILALLIGLAAYIELAAYSLGKQLRILPRKLSFYLILIAIVLVYLILRNFIPELAP